MQHNYVEYFVCGSYEGIDFYPFLDKSRLGDLWDDEFKASPLQIEEFNESANFFQFLHLCLWNEAKKRETLKRPAMVTAVNQTMENPYKCSTAIPLRPVAETYRAYKNPLTMAMVRKEGLILDAITASGITREFMLYQSNSMPAGISPFGVLTFIFCSLFGHQLLSDIDISGPPKPFKIADKFGKGFCQPFNSIETVALYPCGFVDNGSTIVFGDTEENFLLLRPVFSNFP